MYCSFFMKPARPVLHEDPVSADGLAEFGFGRRLSFFYTPFDSAGLVSPWGLRHRESFRETWTSSPVYRSCQASFSVYTPFNPS
jgi:hypothetical protein